MDSKRDYDAALLGAAMNEETDESYLEYLLAESIIGDLMDVYDELAPGEFSATVGWAVEALDHHSDMVEAAFDPQMWVL